MQFDKLYEEVMSRGDESKVLYIMRGISGGGKSHTAKGLAPAENIFSSDDFWGEDYNFDIKKLGIAHQWNQKRVAKAMEGGMTPVVVDNTNTTKLEMEAYEKSAEEFGYEIKYQEPESDWWKELRPSLDSKDPDEIEKWSDDLSKRNSHGVPKEAIAGMMKRWENI